MQSLDDTPPLLDIGTIQDDMSLLTNQFPKAIPQADYLVCRSVTWGAEGGVLAQTQNVGNVRSGEHSHGVNGQHGGHTSGDGSHSHTAGGAEMQHVHDVLVSGKIRGLQPSDRVLVAWVGDDPCVVDLILPATVVG
jgi:hypothetical protein